MPIIDADRIAAEALRVILADISGFWHKQGDESPLCVALARHREIAEARMAEKLQPVAVAQPAMIDDFDFGRKPRLSAQPRRCAKAQAISGLSQHPAL